MVRDPRSRRLVALRLDKRHDVGRRVVLVAIAIGLVYFGNHFLHVALANDGSPLNSRSVVRWSLILCFGLLLVVGSIFVLLRDSRIAPAAIAFRIGETLVVLAVAVRRPLLRTRVGDPVVVSSSLQSATHRSPLLGRVTKTYYTWRISSGERRAEWTAGDPLPELLAREWTDQLVTVGFLSEEPAQPEFERE